MDKRSVESIVAQYEFETDLLDIYVEGESDKALLEWFLQQRSITTVTVYPIDFINITNDHLDKYGLNYDCNRSNVIALSRELHAQVTYIGNVICIADRDFEDYLPSCPSSEFLLLTDGNSLETYAFNEYHLRKLISIVLGGFKLDPTTLLNSISQILRTVYAIRLSNERLKWGMKFVELKSYIKVSGLNIAFETDSCIDAYLNKNNRMRNKKEFREEFDSCLEKLSGDCTKSMRGHDFSEVLHSVITKLRSERKFGNKETLEGVLLGILEADFLISCTLFQRILQFAGQSIS